MGNKNKVHRSYWVVPGVTKVIRLKGQPWERDCKDNIGSAQTWLSLLQAPKFKCQESEARRAGGGSHQVELPRIFACPRVSCEEALWTPALVLLWVITMITQSGITGSQSIFGSIFR